MAIDKIVPLSALSDVPVTEETREQLQLAGVRVPPELTELGGQGLLALHGAGGGDLDAPPSFGKAYDPLAPLCRGCPWSARCWAADELYVQRLRDATGRAARGEDATDTVFPWGVPFEAVAARMAKGPPPGMPAPVAKPPPVRKTPPPPPRSKT